MRILAVVSYKGTNYAGWQKQPNALGVQEVIEKELSKFFNTEITIYGAGRTDAGVHAYGQTFHFDVDVDELDIDRLIYSMNKMLPDDIKIVDMEEVRNLPYRDYVITFETKEGYEKVDTSHMEVLERDDFELSISVRVELKHINDLVKEINKHAIKGITEKKHTLEEFFMKDIGGKENE